MRRLMREIASGKGLNRVMPLDGSVTEGSLLNTGKPGSAPATTSPQAIAEPKLLMGYEKARLGLETQRSQTDRG